MKWVRIAANVLLDLLIALIGTAIIGAEIHIHAYDLDRVLVIEDIRSAAIAFVLGFVFYYFRRTPTSRWLWVAGVIWFAQRAVAYWNSQHLVRVVTHSGHSIYWEMSGFNYDPRSFNDWAFYTLPTLRTVFYSLGAFLCSELFRRGRDGWPMLSSIRIRRLFGEKESAKEEP
jgi:hypothetical protein